MGVTQHPSQPATFVFGTIQPIAIVGDEDADTGVTIPTLHIVPAAPWATYIPPILPEAQMAPYADIQACMVAVVGGVETDTNMGYYAQGRTYAGQSVTTLARVVVGGTIITPGYFVTSDAQFPGAPDLNNGTITLRAYDLTDNSLVYTEDIDYTVHVYYQLFDGLEWTADAIGFNFIHKLDHNNFSLEGAGKKYRLEYELMTAEQWNPTTETIMPGEPIYIVSEVTIDGLLSR